MSFSTRECKFHDSLVALPQKYQHTMAVCSLKKLVKPLLRLLKKKQLLHKTLAEMQQNAYNNSLEDMRRDAASLSAAEDNLANEQLEQRLYHEIRHCEANAAVIVQQGQQHLLVPVNRQQSYIPVNFVRTNDGTFFWMPMVMNREVYYNGWELCTTAHHLDRWGQA
uniref:Enhancer of split malpha protein n=1 Tax=Glossina brevipalpis TaxID=37001 RepID=A0A1A9WRJ6_9MUSC